MAMKRGNGTGTVYKMKHKQLRRPFRAVITVGWTDEGKAIKKTLGYYAKAKEAWEAIAQFTAGVFIISDDVKFKNVWSMMVEEKRRVRSSINSTFKMAEMRLAPIWDMDIQKIKTAQLQHLFDGMDDLSTASLKVIKSLLTSTFDVAMKNDYVLKNYAKLVILPKRDATPAIHTSYSEEDLQTLWANTDDEIARLILCYIYTGMRPAELLHIKIENVNLKERYLVGGAKTKAGINRDIPIAECIYPFIKELYQKGAFSESKLLGAGKETWWLRRKTNDMCKRLGITRHAAHDTRHTFITLAANYGVDDLIIKRIVGHAANDITKSVYIHKNIFQLINAVNSLPYGENMLLFDSKRLSHG